MVELFNVHRTVIIKHLKNIFDENELDETSTCVKIAHMGNNGKQQYSTNYYNLDAIIAVGYRVNLKWATKFRNGQLVY